MRERSQVAESGDRSGLGEIKVYPPREPLSYPLTAITVCKILGISKSTLFRWEKVGNIPSVDMEAKATALERAYYSADLIGILKSMQSWHRADGSPKYRWLEGIDFEDAPEKVVTPTGFSLFLV